MNALTILWAALLQVEAALPSGGEAGWRVIEIGGNQYRFPQSNDTLINQWDDAAEVQMPSWFWQSILGQVDKVTGWQLGASWSLAYITKPNDIFQWIPSSLPLHPPVTEAVELEETRESMRLWRSQGRYKKQNLVYVTYEKHPDIYVKCDRKALDNWMQSCELNWLDGEVMHKLSLAGDWVDKAPIVVERYRATIKSPQP